MGAPPRNSPEAAERVGGDEETAVKISARNSIAGKVLAIRNSVNTSHVDISIVGTILTAEVTNETLEELDLKIGDKVYAVVKPNDIMLATD